MSPLRRRFIEDLKLSGFSERTQEAYVRSVRQLAEHFGTSPDLLSEDPLRAYFVHIRDGKHWARSSITIALCGIKRFYEKTLGRSWAVFEIARPPHEARLPVILTREEVWKILAAVRNDTYRACLTTIYACGLRLTEGARLRVEDIDSARMDFHVVLGKGGRDRYEPLPQKLLQLLREQWRVHRSPEWLFPAPHSVAGVMQPLGRSSLQAAFVRALRSTGIRKKAHVHTLRHSYATHLLEDGVNLRLIQTYLGHDSPKTTSIDTHLTREVHKTAEAPIDRLMPGD
jgi:site-specific recombinase XerD